MKKQWHIDFSSDMVGLNYILQNMKETKMYILIKILLLIPNCPFHSGNRNGDNHRSNKTI